MIIYLITDMANGKQYVGQTIKTLDVRFKEHKHAATGNRNGCPRLNAAIREHGPESFCARALAYASSKKELNVLEKCFIAAYKTTQPEFGYNLKVGGGMGFLGRKHSPETKTKMSATRVGNKNRVGTKHSAVTRAMLSATRMGNKNALGGQGATGHQNFLGHQHTPETKAKIALAKMGNTYRKDFLRRQNASKA